jgi:hypothetical protein
MQEFYLAKRKVPSLFWTQKQDAALTAARNANPDASWRELAQILSGTLSVSLTSNQVRNRLQRVQEGTKAGDTGVSQELQTLQRQIGIYESIETATLQPPSWTRTRSGTSGHKAIATFQLTDTHFDEVISPREIDFANAYNRKIGELRLRAWAEQAIVLARDYIKGVEYEGAVVFATGDILSGDIHSELVETNEATLYESVVHWSEQIIAALDLIAGEFGRLHVAAVVGNHGRNSVKPRYKKRAQSNIEWLLWKIVARYFERDMRVTFQVSDAMDLTTSIYQTNFLLTHGDQFGGGQGIAGAIPPIFRGYSKKSIRQQGILKPFDIMVMGHFHQYLTLPAIIVGGSMKGLDEFAYGINVKPEAPQQAFFVTTPEHGVTIHAPVFFADRKAEGW